MYTVCITHGNFENHMLITMHNMQVQSQSCNDKHSKTCKPLFTIHVICNKSINPDNHMKYPLIC